MVKHVECIRFAVYINFLLDIQVLPYCTKHGICYVSSKYVLFSCDLISNVREEVNVIFKCKYYQGDLAC